jgi:hypothetical protein
MNRINQSIIERIISRPQSIEMGQQGAPVRRVLHVEQANGLPQI